MTLRAYISEKLRAFGVSDAMLFDISRAADFNLDEQIEYQDPAAVGIALTYAIEEAILAPRPTNISEGGFSVSWDTNAMGKYYLWLCKKWDISPDEYVLSATNATSIRDKSNVW